MTSERWKRTEELYHAARERLTDERAGFLAEACADDEALRREVERLLHEPVSDDGFLGGPALVNAAHMFPESAPAAMTGQSVGGYHLQALLGAGGMGEVYRSHDTKLGRDVAIKILPRAFTRNPDRLARFEREARMLAALNHPNICAIYGLEEADGVRFLILELVEGETLADASRNQSRGSGLPLREALSIGRQIADALEVAHERGIIHRDLKPANIKITPDGVVKVLDFGLAKTVDGDGSAASLTRVPVETRDGRREGAVLGTAAYMSPEQARGLAVDRRTDIWAFGCVLYEMLTGRVAFAGDTVSDSIAKILEREPDWSALPAAIPVLVRRLLARCLAKDPKQRLRDIGDVRIEIDAMDEALPGASEVTISSPRRWRAALGIAVVVLSLSTAVTGWLAWGTSRPSIRDQLANAAYTYVTDWEGSELDAAVSVDGKFVAFTADRTGPVHVWLTQLGTASFRNLTPASDDERNRLSRPVGFSVDGSEIWLSGSPSGRRLRVVPFTGGASRLFLEEHAITMAWSSDGTALVYLRAGLDGDALFLADRTGGNAHQILAGKEGEHNHFPTWSKDDQWIYYVHFIDEARSADLWRIPATGGTRERLTEHYSDVRYPTPIDANTLLYVARGEDGSGPWLWELDVERKASARVSVGLDRYLSVAATADGRRLVTAVGKSIAGLWSVPILDRVAEERDAKPYPLPTARALAPRFGGASLFYLSSSGQGDGLWRLQDGNAVEVWKASDGVLLEPAAVSPDGRVAVALRTQGTAHISVVSADGAVRQSLAKDLDVRGASAWSPDAKWIVTGGKDAQGAGLFKIPVEGGTPVRLVTGEAFDPVWSPDGSVIVYAGPFAGGTAPVLALRQDGTSVSLPGIRTSAQGGGCLRFLPDGKGLVYMVGPLGRQGFWLLDLRTNKTRQLARLSSAATTNTFDITPDGKQIVFERLRENSDIVLIDLPK